MWVLWLTISEVVKMNNKQFDQLDSPWIEISRYASKVIFATCSQYKLQRQKEASMAEMYSATCSLIETTSSQQVKYHDQENYLFRNIVHEFKYLCIQIVITCHCNMPTNGELGDNHEVHHTGIYNIYTDINTQYKLIIIRAQRVIFAVGFKKQS